MIMSIMLNRISIVQFLALQAILRAATTTTAFSTAFTTSLLSARLPSSCTKGHNTRSRPWNNRPVSSSSSSSWSRLSVASADVEADLDMPELGKEGVYHIMDERQYKALLDHHKDDIIVLKVFAPWCKACKGLEPKFNALVKDEKYDNLPIVWADLTIQNNKDFVKSIGVLALPTIQFYARSQKLDTFPCGPSKVPILKKKLVQLINDQIDPATRTLKDLSDVPRTKVDVTGKDAAVASETVADASFVAGGSSTATDDAVTGAMPTADASVGDETVPEQNQPVPMPAEADSLERIIQRNKSMLRSNRYLSELLESEFEALLAKATLLTFDSGSIIMREGNEGRTFYIMLDGEVEICQRTSFEDPLTTPPSYLGTVINRDDKRGDYFGERSLITGEPRAASIRATARTRCLAFDKDDFPRTSVLSGQVSSLDEASKVSVLNEVNDKYGIALLDVNNLNGQKQYEESILASQVRGSPNSPNVIDGVDNDMEVTEEEDAAVAAGRGGPVPDVAGESSLGVETATIVPLLMRFKLIRSITRCFDYIVKNRLAFGDSGTRRRRAMLVKLLSPIQRQEIVDAFNLVDEDGDGEINLMELRRLMDSVGQERSDQELLDVIQSSNLSAMDGKKVLTADDFKGLMAEAEIYHLFLDTFKSLDHKDTGFVRAKDLDRVLCGVRDLISDDRNSIIDVEDMEMMVDYEQFSRMLLGTSLKN